MKTHLLEIRENQTLNIGLKLFLSDKIYVSHLFWTVIDLDRFQDDMAERERERDSGKRETRRERGE